MRKVGNASDKVTAAHIVEDAKQPFLAITHMPRLHPLPVSRCRLRQ